MAKILITGGAGFIGSSLALALLNENHDIIIVDNLITGNEKLIPESENCKFVNLNVNLYDEIRPIFQKNKFDYIFHFAALVGVNRTIENPIEVLKDIQGFDNIFNLSVDNKIKRIYYSSSSEVYGEPVHLPQHEESTPLNSRLPYAVVKNVGESYCKSFKKTYNLDYTIFRFFNTYGNTQSEDFVISKFIQCALKNEDIKIYGDGNQSRTFCYIDDTIETIINLFNKSINLNETINIGNDNITTINELVKIIVEITDSKSKILYVEPLKDGDMTRRQPEISKMKKILNRELTPLKEGIKKVINNIN
tara:strand:- start:137 stop:1054 length:918 start_codon:yes stop_codon:yes gene_type:complete